MILSKQQMQRRLSRIATQFSTHAVLANEIGARLLNHLDLIKKPVHQMLVWYVLPSEFEKQLSQRFPKASLHCASCLDHELASIADHSMDLLVMNLSSLYFLDEKKMRHTIARVLKPEGLLLFSSLGPDTLCELRDAWRALDNNPHVAVFEDMHNIGDALLETYFLDPVLDSEHLYFEYDDVKTLARDLRFSALNFPLALSCNGMITPARWQQLENQYRGDKEYITASVEVIYGHAWRSATPLGVVKPVDGVAEIPVDFLRRERF